ncbi:MAG TPA: dephospho-CoA kinase [Candidatus Coprenecus merdigallinarum]|nr:dephospho-CoA kinase [Candidatus Coprenecus merdigallinarum]
MMRTLAVTGGIGSGKSYVVRMFAALGVPVYDADSRTKGLYGSDPELLASLQSILGQDLVRDGVLDRQYMASRIFSDRDILSRVEAVVFPRVLRDFMAWKNAREMEVAAGSGGNAGFVIMESALYLEKPALAGSADKVLTVVCPVETRVERVMVRSGMTRAQVLERMSNQWSDARRISLSDFTVVSDFSHPLLPQVYDIYLKMNV